MSSRQWSLPLAGVAALWLLASPATAQTAAELGPHTYGPPDSAQLARSASRAFLSYWAANTNGSREITEFLRNNSTRPIRVLRYEVRDCRNIPRRTCGIHEPGPLIKPGKTVKVVVVHRERDDEGWGYTFQFWSDWADEPAEQPARGRLPLLLDDSACAGRPADTATIYDPGELDAPVRLLTIKEVDAHAQHGAVKNASALLAFVIGKDGRVEPCSVRVLNQSSPSWGRASLDALTGEQFSIPLRQGRPVRTQGSQRFSYREEARPEGIPGQ